MLVQNNLPRTNNHLEGWNNRFNNMLTHSHPSVWLCIQALQRDNDYNRMILAQVAAGAPPPPQKRLYQDINTRLNNLVRGYQLNHCIQFVRGVAHNLVQL